MPKKTRKEKEEIVAQLKDKLSMQKSAVLTRMSGLNVAEVTDLRKKIREAGGEFKVTKIALIKIASLGTSFEPHLEEITGSTAVVFAYDDPVQVIKAFKGFVEKVPKIETLSGILEDRSISAKEIFAIADLPPRDQLIAMLAGTIAAPISGLASVLAAIPRQLLYSLNAIKEQKENQ